MNSIDFIDFVRAQRSLQYRSIWSLVPLVKIETIYLLQNCGVPLKLVRDFHPLSSEMILLSPKSMNTTLFSEGLKIKFQGFMSEWTIRRLCIVFSNDSSSSFLIPFIADPFSIVKKAKSSKTIRSKPKQLWAVGQSPNAEHIFIIDNSLTMRRNRESRDSLFGS